MAGKDGAAGRCRAAPGFATARPGEASGGVPGLPVARAARGPSLLWGVVLAVSLALAGMPPAALAQTDATVRGGTVTYPSLDVNIADGAKLARLHLAFEVQCINEEAARMAASPQVREAVLLFLRDRSVAELATLAGKRKLRQELVGVMNTALGAPRVVRLYFLQFVIIR